MRHMEEYPVKGEKLFRALGQLDDDIVQEAEEQRSFPRTLPWKKYGAAAAAAVLLLSVALLPGTGWWKDISGSLQPQSGGMESIPEYDAGAGGSGHEEGSTFMSYAGPVFPMTLQEGEEIPADREVRYSFTAEENGYSENGSVWGAEVSDTYVLYNHTLEDRVVTALYPFAGSFRELEKERPRVSLDGSTVETVLYAGGYSGGYMGVWGGEDMDTGSSNLAMPDSWESYRDLLQDGSYRGQALSSKVKLDQAVTVYDFTSSSADLETYPAATQSISFMIDPGETQILTYGWEGMEWDEKSGFRRYSYFVPDGITNVTRSKLLIVLGDDIGDYELQGYRNGGCADGEEIDGVTCEITRYETDLGTVVSRLLKEFLDQYMPEVAQAAEEGGSVTLEMLEQAVSVLVYQDGILSEDVKERYAEGRLEDILSEAVTVDRVFYLAYDLTIPADSQIEVQVGQWKAPSYDFACSGSENTGIQGYDCLTKLDSSLQFGSVKASLENTGKVEIVRQNFGFDLDRGVNSVELDPGQERYYLEIKAKE